MWHLEHAGLKLGEVHLSMLSHPVDPNINCPFKPVLDPPPPQKNPSTLDLYTCIIPLYCTYCKITVWKYLRTKRDTHPWSLGKVNDCSPRAGSLKMSCFSNVTLLKPPLLKGSLWRSCPRTFFRTGGKNRVELAGAGSPSVEADSVVF